MVVILWGSCISFSGTSIALAQIAVKNPSNLPLPTNKPQIMFKTACQVVMVLVLIAFDSRPLWISLLEYVTVIVTVLSGADYFFGLRRTLTEAARRGGSASRSASQT